MSILDELAPPEEERGPRSEGEVAGGSPPPECSSEAVLDVLAALREIVSTIYSTGLRLVADIEATSFDQVSSLLDLLARCAAANPEHMRTVVKLPDGGVERRTVVIDYGDVRVKPEWYDSSDMIILVPKLVASFAEFLGKYGELVSKPRRSAVILLVTRAGEDIPLSSLTYNNLLTELVVSTLRERRDPRYKLVGRVSLDKLLTAPLDYLREVAARTPEKPPAYSTRLRDYYEPPFDDPRALVYPKPMTRYIEKLKELIEEEDKFVVLVMGPMGSGRKTLVYKLASMLDVPAYHMDLIMFQSKYYQESEAKIITFFSEFTMRVAAVAVTGLEYVFRSGDRVGDVVQSMRIVFLSQLVNARRGYYFLVSDLPPAKMVIENPVLSQMKIVVPLPDYETRYEIARRVAAYTLARLRGRGGVWRSLDQVLRRVASSYGLEPDEYIENVIVSTVATRLAGATPLEVISATRMLMIDYLRELIVTGVEPDVEEMLDSVFNVDWEAIRARAQMVMEAARRASFTPAVEVMSRVLREM